MKASRVPPPSRTAGLCLRRMSLDKVNEYFEGEPSEEQESLLPLHPEQQTAESSLESATGEPPRNPAARSVSPMLSRWRGALNPKSAPDLPLCTSPESRSTRFVKRFVVYLLALVVFAAGLIIMSDCNLKEFSTFVHYHIHPSAARFVYHAGMKLGLDSKPTMRLTSVPVYSQP